jgi:hypothetical protein
VRASRSIAFAAFLATGSVASAAAPGGPSQEVAALARRAAACARSLGIAGEGRPLTVIDYSLPSTRPRLWVFDSDRRTVLWHELVAHGKGTGGDRAERFSNRAGSHQSSLGLFLTEEAYAGSNGYSLRLRGLEEGVNHRARERAIVIHGAPYVSREFADRYGRLGRSWGCPAVGEGVARAIIDVIKDGSLVFIYYPDESWLSSSPFLHGCALE